MPSCFKGDDVTAELVSLIRRYPQEIERTAQNMKQQSEVQVRIYTDLDTLNDRVRVFQGQVVRDFEMLLSGLVYGTIGLIVVIAACSAGIDFIQRGVASRIQELLPHLRTYASGDLRGHIDMQAMTFELQSLRDSANTLGHNIRELVGEIQSKSGQVENVSHRVQDASQIVADEMEQQMSQTLAISESMDQMSHSFHEVAEQAANAAGAAQRAEQDATQGRDTFDGAIRQVNHLASDIRETAGKIRELGQEARNIDSVLSVIGAIAEQTNLLALNAAIEAARAGEHGRGFAVVADEVRSLSRRTSQSTHEIREIIERLQGKSAECVAVMDQQVSSASATVTHGESAEAALKGIVSAVEKIRDITTHIAATTEEQASVAEEITRRITRVREISGATRDSAVGTAALSQDLLSQSTALMTTVSRFKAR